MKDFGHELSGVGNKIMFTLKSPLKYFPVSKGDYKLSYSEKYNEFILFEKNNAWMGYDQNSFWQSTEFYIEIEKAYGVCITTGLGLGILQTLLCLKDNVSKVIVYEKSKDVIEIFNEIVKFNNFDISKLEIRNENADLIQNQTCDCLFADHFANEPQDYMIKIVKDLSYNNTAQLVWYWPAGNHFIKFANTVNKPYNKDTYELWKKHTGIKNLPVEFDDTIYSYFTELQRLYSQDVKNGKLHEGVVNSLMRKNMLNHTKKMRDN